MNVLFLTMVKINTLDERGIYTDLLRKFRSEGHNVYVVTPFERRENKKTAVKQENGAKILGVRTFNMQKTNVVEKGLGTLSIEYQYLRAVKRYFSDIKFDLVLYSTPPITFYKVINFIKKRDNAYSYLLLKDIFPQNAVDMGMIKENSFLHRLFLKKERKLYKVSDTIGCMSQANVDFVLNHNQWIEKTKVEVNPNTIEPVYTQVTESTKEELRKKYALPLDKKIFVYGGNLGRPQGLDFLLETISATPADGAFFLVIGSGTEFSRVEKWFADKRPQNAKLLAGLPKSDYDVLLQSCDAGLIFLHKDFTIPNFPSRLLSYLEMKIPVIAATDPNTDIGAVIEQNNCGFSVLSGDNEKMQKAIKSICTNEKLCTEMKEHAYVLLEKEYKVERSFDIIINKLKYV